MVVTAREFALTAHCGQYRKYTGEPYVNHCFSVGSMISRRTNDPEIISAAILHDVVEDTPTTFKELLDVFGEKVTELVLDLTDVYTKEAYPDLNRRRRKALECDRLARVSTKAKFIKMADLVDNTRTIVEYDPAFARVYLREKAAILDKIATRKVLKLWSNRV